MKHQPDFTAFREYLLGESEARKSHIADLLIDDGILKQYTTGILNRDWVERDADEQIYFRNYTDCYLHMGFDYIPVHFWIQNTFQNFPEPETWIAHDKGLITNREEFDRFPWDAISVDYSSLEILESYLPEGMKLVVVTGDFQDLMDCIVGTVSFMMMIYDDPALLDEIINRWYTMKLDLYKTVLRRDSVGAIFTCADMGSSHSSLISPDFIREKMIPWYRRFADAAHSANRMYWFHSCGEIYQNGIFDMLTDEVGIDAFHSFQDCILPVSEFLKRYGSKTAALGGIDLDKLCRLEESELRTYLKETIELSRSNGRYAIGTGNSVADYVPLDRWMILLEEAGNH